MVGAIIVYAPRGPRRTPYQVAGMVAFGLLLAAAIVARTVDSV